MEHNFASKDLSTKMAVKKIDKWINYFVHHAYIKTVVFIVALLEATISPVLPEIVVAGVLAYRKDISWKVLSIVSAIGSTTGVSIVYFAGKYLYNSYKSFFERFLDGGVIVTYTESILNQNTFVTMFLAAFTPLPDRIFAFLAGIFSLQFFIVILAFFCGRLLRVGIIAYFSYHFGDEARHYIVRHTKKVTICFVILIILYIMYSQLK